MEWNKLSWILTELPKYFFITYGIAGFPLREGKKKYLCFLYFLLVPVFLMSGWDTLEYRTLCCALVVIIFFQGRLGKRIQACLLEYFLINAIDVFLWTVLVSVTGVEWMKQGQPGNYFEDVLGLLFLVLPCLLLRKQRKRIYYCLERLHWKWFLALLFTFMAGAGVVGAAQLRALNIMTGEMEQKVMVLEAGAMVAIILLGIVFIYIVYTNGQLKLEREVQEQSLKAQQDYYSQRLEQQEALRAFRHDMRNYLRTLEILEKEGNLEESQRYIRSLTGDLEALQAAETGNAIVNGLLNQLIERMKKSGEFSWTVKGRIPEEQPFSEAELAILFGNALDNAGEALIKLPEEERQLRLESRQTTQDWYLKIANTAESPKDQAALLETDKADKKSHGLGTRNMRRIVEEKGGSVEFYYKEGWFQVEITVKIDHS